MPKFVPRQRKHRVRQRLQLHGDGLNVVTDSNAAEIVPATINENAEKRRRMKDAFRAQQPKMSSKKQKRLDKYIDNKLKKEENLDLIKKLASTKVDTSLLRSSRQLGVSKVSRRGLLSRALREEKAGINLQENHKILFNDRVSSADDSEYSQSSLTADVVIRGAIEENTQSVVGSGLKRSLDNMVGSPITKKPRRPSKAKPKLQYQSELPWNGFSSENDSDLRFKSCMSDEQSTGTQTDSEAEFDDLSENVSVSDRDGSSSSNDVDTSEGLAERKARSSAFKSWATQRVNEALGFSSSTTALPTEVDYGEIERYRIRTRESEYEPLPRELQNNSKFPNRKAFSVEVQRSQEIQEARLGLPVVAEEQKIMEAIYNNSTVVIWGATGSGKTTQVPQFLFEAGFGNPSSPNPGMIGVTQPRRVAAVSMAKRVDDELGNMSGSVSYQIRFESSVSGKTAIKYMTDGILIREVANDFALLKYSAIVIDEAHERSTNTDILIGMVSRIVDLRTSMHKEDTNIKPLKLIIMSATLRIADFMDNPNLFRGGPPPLIQAEGRQYPVHTHFSRRTQRDYVEEAFVKVCRGHKKLPPGGMLVFLTGQNEITVLAKRLRDTFPYTQGSDTVDEKVQIRATEVPLEPEDLDLGDQNLGFDQVEDEREGRSDEDNEEEDHEFDLEDSAPTSLQIHVLPLYSQLQTKDQLRAFEAPPENARLIVLATNVAETSLTIPGIKYVFDCGRAKDKKYDRMTGVQSFEIGWISKASASQRAGRAGRTGPGHCYRLYSSAVYQRDFEEHAEPEILRMPVEGIVLQLKSMDLQHVVNFPFPTPPDRQNLAKAETLLTYLGALSANGKITPVGRELSIYPLSPRFSKMLLIGHQNGCMPYTIAMVAALAVSDIFIPENQLDLAIPVRGPEVIYSNSDRLMDESREQRKKDYNHSHYLFSKRSPTSDAIKALTALCAYAYASNHLAFCEQMFLRPKALTEASHLRQQLSTIVRANHPTLLAPTYRARLPEPSTKQINALSQILAAAFIDQIAIRADAYPSPPEIPRKPSRAIDVPYLPLFPSHQGKVEDLIDIAVFIHPSSVLAYSSPKDLPMYIIYSHLQRGTHATIEGAKKPRTRMHALTAITGTQIAALARGTPLLKYGKPIGKLLEIHGPEGKERECWVIPEMVGEVGRAGWPLPAMKVVQRRDAREGWVIERILH